MKSKILFFILPVLLCTVVAVNAQMPVFPKPNDGSQVPFGQKFPPPVLNEMNKMMSKDGVNKTWEFKPGPSATSKRQTSAKPVNPPSGFHLVKDINTTPSGSDPINYPLNAPFSFAVLNNVSYFAADDGPHGYELWRSDGTAAGTYLVKDIYPGGGSSNVGGIIAASGLLYFYAQDPDHGMEPWVSDGTESGTHLLKDLNPGSFSSSPLQFAAANGSVYFVTSSYSNYSDQLWKTDGTEAGTELVKDLQLSGLGYTIADLTTVNEMAYFVAYTWSSGFQLFRSDGTDAGTYVVKQIGYNYDGYNTNFAQLTAYNNQLYFSVDDGTGRRLWTSDGTFDGTVYAPGYNDVFLRTDFLYLAALYGTNQNIPFSILNNVLYVSGSKAPYTFIGELYKYDASNAAGLVLVKEFTTLSDYYVTSYIPPSDLTVVNDKLYFKLITNIPEWHDELWSTNGQADQTQLVKAFPAIQGTGFYFDYSNLDGSNLLYFKGYDTDHGLELWKSDGTDQGTSLVRDIQAGNNNSYGPSDLTFCNGRLVFSAAAYSGTFGHRSDLWMSDGTPAGTAVVKYINTSTDGSTVGFFYRGISAQGDGVVFNAFTYQLGTELYKSDGTTGGTGLLNDINSGPNWSSPNGFYKKDRFNYFIGDDASNTALYRTNGTATGLKRMTAYINRDIYFVVNFTVSDNGQLFYVLGNNNTGGYELWHSDGTDAGSQMLNANLYYDDYVVTIGNVGYFVAGDFVNGYELWKSNGTLAGTKLVKDINPGYNGSNPYSLYAFKNNLYFGAYDGSGFNNSFWKSDGTAKGTTKLAAVTPAYFNEKFIDPLVPVYCISNKKLYLTATDFNNYGAELWVTNGTVKGTKMLKDINPSGSSVPNHLTDINGTIYFTADDGINGNELWSSGGKAKNTKMVKDITPGYSGSYDLANFCSVGDKLYFINYGIYPPTLWSSDGTQTNTNQVADPVLDSLIYIKGLTPSGNKLFLGAYTTEYGVELYEGDVSGGKFVVRRVGDSDIATEKVNTAFGASVYPNPAHGSASLQIKGEGKNTAVTIMDISGRVMWQGSFTNSTKINLPVEKLTAGMYTVTVRSGSDVQVIKFMKE